MTADTKLRGAPPAHAAAETALNLQRGRPFKKGQSGNPKGKPKGTRNRTTVIAQNLLDGQAEALVRKVVELALEADLTCLRICLERLVPPKKDAPIEIGLPEVRTVADIPKILAAVTAKLGEGGITPSEARTVIDLAEAFRKSLEVADLELRIFALEEQLKSH
jgi:hypothetical protein